MGAAGATDAERLDALRRRLYAPDATEEDVAAYRTAAAADRPEVPDLPLGPTRSPRRAVVGAVVVAVLVSTGIAVLVTAHPLAALTAARTPAPSAASLRIDGELATSASTRARFVYALQHGDHAGLLDYLFSHSAYIPPASSTPGRAASTEYSGQGSSTIALDPSDLTQHGGRVTVFLVLDRAATYSWRAQREVRSAVRGAVLEMAEQAGTDRAGVPTTVTFPYQGPAPTRLDIYTDESVKWGAVVVFTD